MSAREESLAPDRQMEPARPAVCVIPALRRAAHLRRQAAKEPRTVSTKVQQSGMEGVYLAAAELARRGFIVSPTSRSARGADLLITDQSCCRAFAVQVKTNTQTFSYWLVGEHARKLAAPSHIYVLVNLRTKNGTEFYIVPSTELAQLVEVDRNKESTWFYVSRKRVAQFKDDWSPFGDPAGTLV